MHLGSKKPVAVSINSIDIYIDPSRTLFDVTKRPAVMTSIFMAFYYSTNNGHDGHKFVHSNTIHAQTTVWSLLTDMILKLCHMLSTYVLHILMKDYICAL